MTENERREFLKVALAAMAAATGVAGCERSENIAPTCYLVAPRIPLPDNEEQTLKRAELVERLQQLAASEPPELLMGASCYRPAIHRKVEKPCQTCERTMIVGEKDEILQKYNVPLKRIQDQGVNAKLIIPKHCPECGFGLKEEKFQLEIKYPDQPKPVQVELDDAYDLEMMALFLQGKDRYDKQAWIGGGGEEQPLKDKVGRLEELFGIKEKKREELIERLKQLGEEEPPKKIEDIGAMCYVVLPSPDLRMED